MTNDTIIRPPTLSSRVRNLTLMMLALTLVLGALALPQVSHLGGAIRETLYRNYISIEAAQHMQAALDSLQRAELVGNVPSELPAQRREFQQWIGIELSNITEIGESALAHQIDDRGTRLLNELAATPPGAPPGARHDPEFATLRRLLDRLVLINRDAMFRADSRASRMSRRVAYEFGIGLVLLLMLGIVVSVAAARSIARPLDDLADRLRSLSLRAPSLRLGPQRLAELQSVAVEFNRMAERLEKFERLNVDRLLYEKRKTEAIIESLEDGVVLIDPRGVVTHINEIAAIIVGVSREEALGSQFSDLNSNHPHYLRVRAALHDADPSDYQRVEVELHVRGRDHTYVLKRLSLAPDAEESLGTMLILQDITYLRDKDRARVNLVATLSHELRTPLTSLAIASELLQRNHDGLAPKQIELVDAIGEDVDRMRNLADDLLDLARGETGAIAIHNRPLDLVALVAAVTKTLTLQAQHNQVQLETDVTDTRLRLQGDPVKLSWVLSNLIGNALRYTPAGGKITIGATRSEDTVQLTVSDTGPGVPDHVRDHIFERFSQWNVNGAEAGSAGLGLAIVKEIVEAHGGRIFVESSPAGSLFRVELPAEGER
jgi:NtrC-family two-component system sensor histidine kinase KinB